MRTAANNLGRGKVLSVMEAGCTLFHSGYRKVKFWENTSPGRQ